MRVVDTKEMDSIKKRVKDEFGLLSSLVIENTAVRGAQVIHQKILSQVKFFEIIVLAGPGA